MWGIYSFFWRGGFLVAALGEYSSFGLHWSDYINAIFYQGTEFKIYFNAEKNIKTLPRGRQVGGSQIKRKITSHIQLFSDHESPILRNTPSVPVKCLRFSVTVYYKVVGAGM